MLALDFDGVVIGDLRSEYFNGISEFLNVRHHSMLPIFQPSGEYYIVTGRPKEDELMTFEWISNHLKVQPKRIFHDNLDFANPVEYKSSVILSNPEIDIFIESDILQVKALQSLVDSKVLILHWGSCLERVMLDVKMLHSI